jgi:hypothetical protein
LLIDPKHEATMSLEAFKRAIADCNPALSLQPTGSRTAGPVFEDAEITSLFKNVTKAAERTSDNRLVGVKLKTQDLATKVYQGVKTILVDQVRVTLEKAQLSLSQLFTRYDMNKDGLLEHKELLRALSDCRAQNKDKDLSDKMADILLKEVLDPRRGGNKNNNRSAAKEGISYGVLKFYIESCGPGVAEGSAVARSGNQIDSGKGAGNGVSDSVSSATGFTSEMLQMCKKAARKILSQCHNNIVDIIG